MHRFTSSLTRLAIVSASMLLATSAVAQQEEIINNDSFDNSQMQRIATAQLVEGEMYAATFDIPQSWLPVEMLGVRVIMVDGDNPQKDYCGRYTIEVYEESTTSPSPPSGCPIANHKPPGNVIYSMSTQMMNVMNPVAFEVIGDPNNFQDLRFASVNNNPQIPITIPQVMINVPRVRVGVQAYDLQCGNQAGDDFPLILTDVDGESAYARNFLYGYPKDFCSPPSYFYLWGDFSFFFGVNPGDFVLRLILRRNVTNPMPDMGMGMPDMGMDMPGEMGGGDMVVVDIGPDGSMNVVDMMEEDLGGEPDSGGEPDLGEPDSGGEIDLGGNGMNEDMATAGNNDANNTPNNNTPAGMLEVTSVSPSSVSEGESVEIAILGKDFEPGLEVTLNARKIGVVETKPQRILATAPGDLDAGSYDVIVTNPNGDSAILSGGFTVTASTSMSDGQLVDMGDNGQNPGRTDSPEGGCGCRQAHKSPSVPAPLLAMVLGLVGLLGLRRRR
jgi:MYXO-CTERM domain-containing protein